MCLVSFHPGFYSLFLLGVFCCFFSKSLLHVSKNHMTIYFPHTFSYQCFTFYVQQHSEGMKSLAVLFVFWFFKFSPAWLLAFLFIMTAYFSVQFQCNGHELMWMPASTSADVRMKPVSSSVHSSIGSRVSYLSM